MKIEIIEGGKEEEKTSINGEKKTFSSVAYMTSWLFRWAKSSLQSLTLTQLSSLEKLSHGNTRRTFEANGLCSVLRNALGGHIHNNNAASA